MTITTSLSTQITQTEAESLWSALVDAFNDVEGALSRIIKAQAWVPLGYDSFSQAWADKMKGVHLAAELRAPVVYAMFAEGLDVEEVRKSLGVGSGLAKGSITVLKTQRDLGVPAGQATTRVRSFSRVATRSKPGFLHIDLGEDLLADYQDRADAVGADLKKIVIDALALWYSASASRASRAS